MPDAPSVSVVVATFRRPAGLTRLLDALAAQQDAPPFEVLVSDNDTVGSAAEVVAAPRPWRNFPPTYLREPRPGASHARNLALSAARAPVVVVTDDDVVPQPGWLAALVGPIDAGRADVTGGPVFLDPTVRRPRWLDEAGIGGYLTRFDLGSRERELVDPEYLVTANIAFRRALVDEIGGFDPRMGPRGGVHLVSDDTRLVWALRAKGAIVHYVPTAVVHHELPAERMQRRYLLRRAFSQGRSDWLVERERLTRRRFRGVRVPLAWLRVELGRRSREGVGRADVRFHACCDLARTMGAVFQCFRG